MSGPSATGLERFRGELDPALLREIRSWAGDEKLDRLHAGLRATRDRDKFFNICAEAMVARHLLARGCELQVEVATPAGRSCDFEAHCDGVRFYLHVKRLGTKPPTVRQLNVSSRLRYLERIRRPFVVSVRLRDGLGDRRVQRFVAAAAEFIRQARVREELVIRDEEGEEIGGCRIVAPSRGGHVTLLLGLPSGLGDEAPRMRRLLSKAYRQFMPGETNVILLGSSHEQEAEDFATALLGSHIERWDAHPPEGRRVAHGRDADGFWSGGRHPESVAAGWFHFDPRGRSLHCRFWIRRDAALPDPVRRTLLDVLST